MIVGKISLAQPYNTQRSFGTNQINKREITRALDEAKHSSPPIIFNYKPEFIEKITESRPETKGLVVGITGESASGKSTLANAIKDFAIKKGLSLSLMTCDNYYMDFTYWYKKYGGYAQALFAGEDLENPSSFNLIKMNEDLENLKRGKTILTPDFNFSTGISTPNIHEVKPAKIMLVEGIVANNNAANDINIYVDCPDDVKRMRALARAQKRGSTPEAILKMWEIVRQSAQKHIVPLREKADVILNGETNIKELNIFMEKMLKAFKK